MELRNEKDLRIYGRWYLAGPMSGYPDRPRSAVRKTGLGATGCGRRFTVSLDVTLWCSYRAGSARKARG
ncbi:hypothetical protein Aaci_1085 [Alicyclobacillus acidocaldarius subsp. acidocaldarius DSM 446]|uniref:Uncharacterized protein n=1 Tax=Alicyclobacillus acidocaldarius subsp. acidocaldarius (strain ATCC 27009 / DSM 446 / BCRC 14685 / JCM 5260 / KCTC 1825 / NBRC 15652 / NCIMB 11725 / NRRL B-14509 / 104-IA) TaxID=521098 RepID=C8WVJ9_ALIAD|nr:hypothetical protein Aaci_1085 [Alicyclobacillus acidocaldarius subsp. acidocaldarius DSM 446]